MFDPCTCYGGVGEAGRGCKGHQGPNFFRFSRKSKILELIPTYILRRNSKSSNYLTSVKSQLDQLEPPGVQRWCNQWQNPTRYPSGTPFGTRVCGNFTCGAIQGGGARGCLTKSSNYSYRPSIVLLTLSNMLGLGHPIIIHYIKSQHGIGSRRRLG